MRVLVVEDEDNIREYLSRHLRNEGYAVDGRRMVSPRCTLRAR